MNLLKTPCQYTLEANQALLEKLDRAIQDENWDEVEACASALYEFAQTFTKSKGPNA